MSMIDPSKKERLKKRTYSIGLDLGVGSVGWAAIDESAHLLKKGNRNMWGYSVYEEAKNAQERRSFRGARRRLHRRRLRIKQLQDFLSEMIFEVDELFFKRMDNSWKIAEDRDDDIQLNGSLLFGDDIADKEYYSEYPTIYHLRWHLCNSDEKADPRLIYLALHHIVKYRGNFLREGQEIASNPNIAFILEDALNDFSVIHGVESLNDISADSILSIMRNSSMSKSDKVKAVEKLGDSTTKKVLSNIAKALVGNKFTVSELFPSVDYNKVSFGDDDFEGVVSKVENAGEFEHAALLLLEDAYGFLAVESILAGSSSISEAMIERFNKHGADLKMLKDALKNYPVQKKDVFGERGFYEAYVHPTLDDKMKRLPQDEFYKKIKSIFKDIDFPGKENMEKDFADGVFMPRQNSRVNGQIPYQLHLNEARMIIEHQSKYYPCLAEHAKDIYALITSRIPYYVGPLEEGASNRWLVRTDDSKEPLRAWNYKDRIDVDETARKFIDRMRNHCTYLLAEDTLPKNSMILKRFNLYNELNKIKCNDKPFDKTTKEAIINDLFLTKQTVTAKALEKWLRDHQYVIGEECKLDGFQSNERFASNLSSEIKFRNIFGEDFDKRFNDIEEMINDLTVYNDKEIIERRLGSYEYLTAEQKNQILRLRFEGYGRFSAKLINGLFSDYNTKYNGTILTIMQESNLNFMEILYDSRFGFIDKIEQENNDTDGLDIIGRIEELPCSPALKRTINQAIKIVEDIVGYEKSNPARIYIEFAREESAKKRTLSRYDQLEAIYKQYYSGDSLLNELNSKKGNLSDERLYLYFIQGGKCMYSGRRLDINRLEDYQIDHIIPQCYTTDNSFENRVLVLQEENQRKNDSLLLSPRVQKRMKDYWDSLHERHLIGDKKYTNLNRTHIGEKMKERFINRQLVETRQISMHVKDLLASKYPDVQIVVVHAPLSSEFRKKFELYKIRDLNNAHHAQDAYLACIMGNFIVKKYPSFIKNPTLTYKTFEKDIFDRMKENVQLDDAGNAHLNPKRLYSLVVNQMTDEVRVNPDGEEYWGGKEFVAYVKKAFAYKDYFYNYPAYIGHGELFNATIYKKGKKGELIPLGKGKDTSKYGGYSSGKTACGLLVEYKKGKKKFQEIITLTVLEAAGIIDDYDKLEEFAQEILKTDSARLIRIVKLNQTFISNGALYTMVSPTERKIRQPLFANNEEIKLLNDVYGGVVDENHSESYTNLFFSLAERICKHVPEFSGKYNKYYASDILKKAEYENVNMFGDEEKSKEYYAAARAEFNIMPVSEKSEAIRRLVSSYTGSRSNIVINGKMMNDRLFRYDGKKMKYEINAKTGDSVLVEFVYTSPSGIYNTHFDKKRK